ncbi:MAG: cbb3-type cytochrome c oxidase subunit 3 [Pseudomonadota bacterium]
METYSILREFADSWFLIAMFAFFIGAGIFAFLPGQRAARDDAAGIPFRDDQPHANTDPEGESDV